MSSALQNTEDCSPSSKSADKTQQIPDLTAETPQGTVMKWEELFEVIPPTLNYHLFKIHFTHFQTRGTKLPKGCFFLSFFFVFVAFIVHLILMRLF